MAPVDRVPQTRRSRGVRAGLDRRQIVEAARTLDPDSVTMQAVADELGVDRKAVNHHVSDRETLLGLVAMDAFAESFSAVQIASSSDWKDACRTYAIGFSDAVITIGPLADHLQLDNPLVTTMLQATEIVLNTLIEAGADDATALRSLVLLTNICLGYARDVTSMTRTGVRPRPDLLHKAMSESDAPSVETLARVSSGQIDTYDRRQLEMSIDVFIRGTEALLVERLSEEG